MRLIVTGGAGFIGSNLVRRLASPGCEILILDKLTYAGNRASLADILDSQIVELRRIDLADATATHEAVTRFAPDAIVHLAAESHVDRSIDGPAEFIQSNILGTFNLLQAARIHWQALSPSAKGTFRFLHVSTDEVYGSLGPDGAFNETTRYDPHSPYSASKAASDHLARAWHTTYGLPVLVTHCSNNYGPYQFPEKLIPVVILKALAGDTIPVYGDGLNVRDWLHVEDHCDALVTVLKRGEPGQTYNIGGNNEMPNLTLVHRICDLLDELCPREDSPSYADLIRLVADRPGHDRRYAINASKLQSELGWSPRHSADSGLRQTVRWYLENRDWWNAILDGSYQLERLGQTTAASAH